KGASILISGDNFGCGSSREHAAWALKDFGFLIIIAGSFSDIFYMNCTKNGMLPIAIENKTDRESIAQHSEITIDLLNQEIITQEAKYHFDIDATWKNKLVKGLDDIAITLTYEDQINEYENTHNEYRRDRMTLKTRLSTDDIEDAFLKLKYTVKQTPLKKDLYL